MGYYIKLCFTAFALFVSLSSARASLPRKLSVPQGHGDVFPESNNPGSPVEVLGIWRGHITITKYDSRPGYRDGELFGVVSPTGHQMWLTEEADSERNLNTIDNRMLSWKLLDETESGDKTYEFRFLQDVTGPSGGSTEQEVCQQETVKDDRSTFHGMYGTDCADSAESADFHGYKTLMHEVMPPLRGNSAFAHVRGGEGHMDA